MYINPRIYKLILPFVKIGLQSPLNRENWRSAVRYSKPAVFPPIGERVKGSIHAFVWLYLLCIDLLFQELNPKIKVLAISAVDEDWIREKAIQSGCFDFLGKPFETIQLLDIFKFLQK